MSLPNTPSKDSPDLHLVIATPEELLEQWKANSVEWRGALPTTEAYLRREELLAAQDLTKDGGLTAWMLVHQLHGSTRRVLCGCESIRKRALIARNGEVIDTTAHGIAGVFCPPANRGHGYAGRMMSDLAVRLKDWLVPKGSHAGFSVLYSDIGKDFYAARGWKPFASAHISLPPTVTSSTASLPSVRRLTKQDIPALCAIDEQVTRQRLAQMSTSGRTAAALLPDAQTMAWHFAKEDFVTQEICKKTPEDKGGIVGESSGSRVWCYWQRVYSKDGPNTLHILRLTIEDPAFTDFGPAQEDQAAKLADDGTVKAVAAVLRAAQEAAAQWDMNEVQLWNTSSTSLAAARLLQPNSTITHRETDSIASLLWYGDDDADVDWVSIEKYGWC